MDKLNPAAKVAIVTPNQLLSYAITEILKSEFPQKIFTATTLLKWENGEQFAQDIELLILDSANALYQERLLREIRRKKPRMALFALTLSPQAQIAENLFDEILTPDTTPTQLRHLFQQYLAEEEGDNPEFPLTHREVQVLRLFVLGNTAKEIAEKLCISTHTVNSHRKNLSLKLGIKSLAGLAIYAATMRIVEPHEVIENEEDEELY